LIELVQAVLLLWLIKGRRLCLLQMLLILRVWEWELLHLLLNRWWLESCKVRREALLHRLAYKRVSKRWTSATQCRQH
jgi:hypothetical protein